MRTLLFIFMNLFFIGNLYADTINSDELQAFLYNHESSVTMLVNYQTCYTYDSVLWGKDAEYCSKPQNASIDAFNSPKGSSYVAIKWNRTPGSIQEYVRIINVTLKKLDGTDFGSPLAIRKALTSWYMNSPRRPVLIFTLDDNTLIYSDGTL